MVYFIVDKKSDKVLFDIEWFIDNNEKYFSEIHVYCPIGNIFEYVWENLMDVDYFKKNEIIQDFRNIQELRMWLWEIKNGNSDKSLDIVEQKHKELQKELKQILDDFCNKYNFKIEID